MNKAFFIADTHFGHSNIIKYEGRPFETLEDMDQVLIYNWNSVVDKQDKVFVLGDFSFYNAEQTTKIISELRGHKTLIMGNHDRSHSVEWWRDVGFDQVSECPIIWNEFYELHHEPPYANETSPRMYLYGHVHGNNIYHTVTHNSACVSCERWNYTPVTLGQIEQEIRTVKHEQDIIDIEMYGL